MLKYLLNSTSPMALFLCGPEDERAAARAAIAANVIVGDAPPKTETDDGDNDDGEDDKDVDGDEDGEDGDDDGDNVDPPENETDEEKTARIAKEAKTEADEKIKKKEARKQERITKKFAKEAEARRVAEARVAVLEAQLAADPEKKLTEEEVQTRAEKLAEEKLNAKQAKDNQDAFDAACAKLAKAGEKLDDDFADKITEMAEAFGPIPGQLIGILEDLENGAEVLVLLANDDDEAEAVYKLANSPGKMGRLVGQISDRLLADAKKKTKREISKVPAPLDPVRSNGRVVNGQITEQDTKDMDKYVAKRAAQRAEQIKTRGY